MMEWLTEYHGYPGQKRDEYGPGWVRYANRTHCSHGKLIGDEHCNECEIAGFCACPDCRDHA